MMKLSLIYLYIIVMLWPNIKSYKVSEKYMIVQGRNLPNSLCIPIVGISIELWNPKCLGQGLGGQILSKSSNI
jgi:hypothetical protein